MKPLPERFNSDGFAFRLIFRDGRVALLGKRKSGWRPELELWEVVLIQRVGDHTFPNGVLVPAHEAMPTDGCQPRLDHCRVNAGSRSHRNCRRPFDCFRDFG
jgi:hypothetical protein